jgi:hypothetical protein
MRAYLFEVLIALDQLLNALLGGCADETLSSRAAKARQSGMLWGCVLCRILDAIDRDHCAKSIEHDEGSDHQHG